MSEEAKLDSENFYTRLGVAPDATDRAIKKSYLFLAKIWHPDKCTPADDAEEFRKTWDAITEAYDVLRDPDQRAYYDRNGVGKLPKPPSQDDIDKFMVINFENMIQGGCLEREGIDPFKLIQSALKSNLYTERGRIPAAEKEIAKLKEDRARLKFHDDSRPNPLLKVFDGKMDEQRDIIKNATVAIALIDATLAQMGLYGWDLRPRHREGSFQIGDRRRPGHVDDIPTNRARREAGDISQEELRRIHNQGPFGMGRDFYR